MKVKISPVYRNKIKFIPINSHGNIPNKKGVSDKNLIVGVDPGTNCGLAILTLVHLLQEPFWL